MEFKGTPGPWYTSNEGRLLVRDEEWQCVIADSIGCNGDEEEVANARLIAAAPDLLYSLQKLLTEYKFTRSQLNGDTEEDLVDVLCVRNAMAAINKALGRE